MTLKHTYLLHGTSFALICLIYPSLLLSISLQTAFPLPVGGDWTLEDVHSSSKAQAQLTPQTPLCSSATRGLPLTSADSPVGS